MIQEPSGRVGRVERFGFSALAALILSQVVAHAVWRPLVSALHVAPSFASVVTGATLVVATVSIVVQLVAERRGSSMAKSGASAALVGLVIGAATGGMFGLWSNPMAAISLVVPLLIVAIGVALLVRELTPRLPAELDGLASRRKVVSGLMLLVALVAVVQTARVSTFMSDASRPEFSLLPGMPFLVHHSCLTAYVQAARLASDGASNVYDANHWPDLGGTDSSYEQQRTYAPFALDAYAYPPPFLLLPRALLLPLGDFGAQRAFWFGCNALFLALGLWVVASFLETKDRARVVLLMPVIWVTVPTLLILQIGNVHATVLVMAMVGMVAFARDRAALGGAFLAFATLSKISPGLLVLVLLLHKRFREVAWTAAWGVFFVGITYVVFGAGPFEAFLSYELPRLSSGEALRFMTRDESLPINMAPFGVPFKLAYLGVDIDDPWATARRINAVFSVALVVLTVWVGRKRGGPRAQAMLWLSLLTLGTLRSPFAPAYVAMPLFWMFSLWAVEVKGAVQAAALGILWVFLSNLAPLPPHQVVVMTLVQQAVFLSIVLFLALRTTPAAVLDTGYEERIASIK